MSNDKPIEGHRALQWVPIAGIALATPFLVWFGIGDSPLFAEYRFGPYEVGPESGFLVGGTAAIVAAVSVAVLVSRTRRGVGGGSWAVAWLLVVAGTLGASGWRIGTSSYSGADIGGPVVLLIAPLLIAWNLVGAVWIAWIIGRWRLRWTWLATAFAVLVAPMLYAVMSALTAYDAAAGLITAKQYAEVQVGHTRSAVHEMLGREGSDEFAVLDFAPVPPGLLCDYYVEVDAKAAPLPQASQFCFLGGVLVSKDASVGEPFAK